MGRCSSDQSQRQRKERLQQRLSACSSETKHESNHLHPCSPAFITMHTREGEREEERTLVLLRFLAFHPLICSGGREVILLCRLETEQHDSLADERESEREKVAGDQVIIERQTEAKGSHLK